MEFCHYQELTCLVIKQTNKRHQGIEKITSSGVNPEVSLDIPFIINICLQLKNCKTMVFYGVGLG